MTWFAFKGYSDVDLAGVQEKEAVSFGFHGYATQAQADANPNNVNFLQKAWVDLIERDYSVARSTGQQPGGPNANPLNPSSATGALGDAAKNLIIKNLPDWAKLFLGSNGVQRLAEGLFGIVLIAVGVRTLMGNAI